MKTTKADFNLFKKAFIAWQYKLGLTQYDAYFEHVFLKGLYAQIYIDQMGKSCTVRLNKEAGPVYSPKDHAKHEAIHLLLSRLSWLAQARYIENHDIEEEEESLVRRLEKVL